MEEFLFSPEEPTLFSIIGIGGVADEIVNTLRLQNLRATTFINLSDANEAVTGYLETVNELLPEESNYPKVVILITDLSEGVETNHILTLIHAIKKKEQLLVLFPVTHCPCEVQSQADMLLITDKEKLYQYLKPCSVVDLQREFQRLLCQQVIDLVETSTVPGLIHLDFRELKYFIASLPQHAVYYSGYGMGEQRVQKAIKEVLHSSVLYFSSDFQSFSSAYIIIQCNEQSCLSLEELAIFQESLLSFFNKKSFVPWGIQCRTDISDSIHIFMFAKTNSMN